MKELYENWQETKTALLEGLDPRRSAIVSTVLDNQVRYLSETANADVTQVGNIGNFQKIILPMIRRIIPGTIATEIVGVQPMTGPTGLVFSLRFIYKNQGLVDPLTGESPAGDINPGDEVFGNSFIDPNNPNQVFASKMRRFYAGGTIPPRSGGIYDRNGFTSGTGVGPAGQGVYDVNTGVFTPYLGTVDPVTGLWTSSGNNTPGPGKVPYGAGEYGTYPQFAPGGFATNTAGAGTPGYLATGIPGDPFGLANPLSGEAGDVVDMEAWPGRNLGLQVLRQAVTAKTRKLQAKWTIEAMQDLSSQHGLDLEAEITQALSAEIVHEIDNEIICDLIRLAGTVEIFDMAAVNFTGVPNYVGDRYAVLGILINKVANEIAAKTRRAGANFAIASPALISVLQSATKSVFAPAVQGSFQGPNNTRLSGTLNGSIKVYSFLFNASFGAVNMQSANPGLGATATSDIILVGYKGGNGETDTGYFYCPYIPLMTSNTVVDPQTYNNQLMVLTRYGKVTFTQSNTSLANSADYYGKIVVSNLSFI